METKVGTTEIQGLKAMLGCEQVVKCSILGEEYKGLMAGGGGGAMKDHIILEMEEGREGREKKRGGHRQRPG